MAAPSSSSLASSRLVQARSQPATAAGDQHREQHGSGPGQTEDNQERSVPAHEAGPKRSSLHGMTATGNHNSLGERLDRPPVTHRLDDQAAPTPLVTRRLPRSLTPKRCTATLLKAPAPDSLKLPPP